MAVADLEGPFDDFRERTKQLRTIICTIEAAGITPSVLTSARAGIDLSIIGPVTANTVNAMSLVFLASSFEEFLRDEIVQCSAYLADRYSSRPISVRHSVRNAYWVAAMQKLNFRRSILNKDTKVPDGAIIGQVSSLLDTIQRFVVADDAALVDGSVFTHHTRNFRPDIVDEIAKRIGVFGLLARAAESSKIKTYFGVATKAAAAEKLRGKLNEFYDRRNEIVHSLSGATGFAVNVVLDYLDLFEMTAESIRNVLTQELAAW